MHVPGACVSLACACPWCVCVTGLCMSLARACSWCVCVTGLCVSLVRACPWRVHVLGVCVLLVYACPWRVRIPGVCVSLMCVCVTRLCMSRVCVCPCCVRVQAVCGPMCVAGEGLPSVTWMPHCWGLCTRPAPLLPHGRGLPVSFLTSCFPGGHRTILRVLPLPSLGAGGR